MADTASAGRIFSPSPPPPAPAVEPIRAALRDPADQELIVKTIASIRELDLLINNAGFGNPASFHTLAPEKHVEMLQVHVVAPVRFCRAVLPAMRKQQSGKIVNISSGTALNGSAGRIHYVTSKAGVIGFTRTLAREVGDDNINVNAIAPGSTLSEDNPSEEILKMRGARVADRCLKRVQLPKDLVGTVLFLSSPLSDFMTGQTVAVDGGVAFL